MKKITNSPLTVLLFDAFLVNATIVATFVVRFLGDVPERNYEAYRNTGIFITLVYLAVFYLQGLYDFSEDDDSISILFKVIAGATLGTIGVTAITFISRDFAYPRTVLALSWAFLALVLGVWRLFVLEKFLSRLPEKNTAIFGGKVRGEAIRGVIEGEGRRKFRVRRVLDSDAGGELRNAIESGEVQSVIITDEVPGGSSLGFELSRKYTDLTVYVIPGVSEIVLGAFHHHVVGDIPMISVTIKPLAGRLRLLKRGIDLLGAAIVIVAALPVFAATAALVKLTSPGPVFYRQERVGMGGKIFKIAKFRTMVKGAEEETGPVMATEDDPRNTPVGRFLRRYRVDELPQMWNVLKGEMSLVGPRPERPEFVEQFEREIPGFSERKKALPGVTGLAQVNGKYDTDPSMKLKYDLLYIYNYSLYMDFAVLYQTVQHLIRAEF
ncbi:MAG: sugar transferase [bacterium]